MLDVVTAAAYDNIHGNLYTGLVFVDLRKAFDTVLSSNLFNQAGILRVSWSYL